MNELQADVLVVGGSTGGTAAAIQSARRGAKTLLVSEFPWLGGMLTTAGVSAPDGNELAAFQTGLWGEFLQSLQCREGAGLDQGWVSFFTFDPRTAAQIFADWVKELPNLHWISGQVPVEVLRDGNAIAGVCFQDFIVKAQITLDGTELGDLLALAEIPYRWGWEFQGEWQEPSAPVASNLLTERYPVQAPTWVVVMQDYGEGARAPEIPAPPIEDCSRFLGAWDNYGPESFLNYGRLPGNRFMINWPIQGNDYGEGVGRLVETDASRLGFLQEARSHSQSFARFIQSELGPRYGLAEDIFPSSIKGVEGNSNFSKTSVLGGGAYALHPYYRESRRLVGVKTVTETDILPALGGRVAKLSVDESGVCDAIALGNYANDHHYPDLEHLDPAFKLAPKSIPWGGRWTGTPFTIPYGCLVPGETDGLLVCEKNISVSHIANGATRLQPVVMGIGQAAGMAAALCVEQHCQPRDLPVRMLQEALLQDAIAPAALVPLFNRTPEHGDWLDCQIFYLENPEEYPLSGDRPNPGEFSKIHQTSSTAIPSSIPNHAINHCQQFIGVFQKKGFQDYAIALTHPVEMAGQSWSLVTWRAEIDGQLKTCPDEQVLTIWGRQNSSGNWIIVEELTP
ncbi:FAD-dependent oxidoreductase [Oscillatoria sp. HE19RPO]|uniref:FAD-dependent oxidoreductase n=1 Tax=Oscillatoria sp. HE19RPO TaxID=2954806 RepID=UPI0020C4015F|nr:FAD-dependent oxidoreductase [Oscillatoria sp. HE19RPO]